MNAGHDNAGAGQQHLDVGLRNVLEVFEKHVIGVDILRQPVALFHLDDDREPLIDRHVDDLFSLRVDEIEGVLRPVLELASERMHVIEH